MQTYSCDDSVYNIVMQAYEGGNLWNMSHRCDSLISYVTLPLCVYTHPI